MSKGGYSWEYLIRVSCCYIEWIEEKKGDSCLSWQKSFLLKWKALYSSINKVKFNIKKFLDYLLVIFFSINRDLNMWCYKTIKSFYSLHVARLNGKWAVLSVNRPILNNTQLLSLPTSPFFLFTHTFHQHQWWHI